MSIKLIPQTEQGLKEVASYIGLPEEEIVDLAVSTFLVSEEARVDALLLEEIRAWRDLSIESLYRFEEKLITS